MDEIAKILIGSSPILAVVLLLGVQLLNTVKDVSEQWHEDRVKAEEQRGELQSSINDLTRRVKLLEEHQIGEVSPTLVNRPT